ncbi:MAG: hypothetical protein QOC60_110 [Frankiaceae bacterium]|nr:hypothetical protein [Frankiaceae bacterium]
MAFDPQRFVQAQMTVYDDVVAELRRGRKVSHWMWFVFPQLAGLGRSATAQYYALDDLEAARDYVAHELLGSRLVECSGLLTSLPGGDPVAVFGAVDAQKLQSSMTLFSLAASHEPVFRAVLDKYFAGRPDVGTTSRV